MSLTIYEYFDQYGSFEISSQIMPCYSNPASLGNQNEIPLEFSCEQSDLGQIRSLMSMRILTNIAQIQYYPR